MIDTATAYLRAGLCVLPAILDEKRPALSGWKQYQRRLPTERQVAAWFAADVPMCILAGAVSGNLEMIDFDYGGELFDRWKELVATQAPGLVDRLLVERSQSDGRHAIYRCRVPVSGNRKLAQRTVAVPNADPVVISGKRHVPRLVGDRHEVTCTLIETRGEGGLFLCAPTPGYQIEQGAFVDIPVLDEAERTILIEAACALNETLPRVEAGDLGSASSGRPGDDFNERGDVRELLRRHGWQLVRGGDNEYWRRPGKEQGWSATLKDGVLYVFSSNAAPFEPERAYAPFGVYTLLEHAGDYTAAAGALRAEGFGSDTVADGTGGVDISALVANLVAPPADRGPAVPDPGPIPDQLFHVPGFIEQVMGFTMANAPYPNVGLAFSGAIALQSFLAGRKVCTAGDLRPNLYLLALASSGTGKDFPRKVNSRLLFEVGLVGAIGDKFASGEGIQDALVRSNAMLFQNDEMDGVLRQINLDRENRRESIPNILLTLYTSANDVYPIRVKAGQKETVHIDQPHLTLFGTATPQYFYESLCQRMLTNGFFARMIVI
ncbi:MAG: bifunctional DNA primase/polymerase, partial [Planctomycetaceae bacterium]|nr:bifunctional DNA primase/polymerase [Planctomycetaceae bacterium]